MRRRAQVIPTAAARRRSAAPAPTAMTRPREEAGEDSEAASALAPEAGSSACEGVGVMVKGLTGAGMSMNGPTVPLFREKNASSTLNCLPFLGHRN